MDKRARMEMRARIGEDIDISSSRLKEGEISILHDIVTHLSQLVGTTSTHLSTSEGWSSEGKYTRKVEDTYTLTHNEGAVQIEHVQVFHDDDGMSGRSVEVFSSARDILRNLELLFG